MPAHPPSRLVTRIVLMLLPLFVCLVLVRPAPAASITFQHGTTYTGTEDIPLFGNQGTTNARGGITVGATSSPRWGAGTSQRRSCRWRQRAAKRWLKARGERTT